MREFTAELNRQRSDLADEKVSLQSELERATRRIDKLVGAILEGANALAVNAKLQALEANKAVLIDKLSTIPAAEPLLHPALATVYRNKVACLEHALRAPDTHQEAFELIRGLIDSVQLMPVAGELEIELRGDLAAILALSEPARGSRYSPEKKALQTKLVAGARNHLDLQLDHLTTCRWSALWDSRRSGPRPAHGTSTA